MEVYHGTAARFPIKQLTYGPDTSAQLGTPMPGLWLTNNPKQAAAYASWSADCTKSDNMRVIALEMDEGCPRWHNPRRTEDFVIRSPEREYENGNLKVIRAYRVKRKKVFDPNSGQSVAWMLQVRWNLAETEIVVPNADVMEALPVGFMNST